MKHLLLVTLFLVSTTAFGQGIERNDDSRIAKRYSWKKILNSSNYTPDSLSYISPRGASLFNVCAYDDNHFQVLKPNSECVEYKKVENIDDRRRGGEKTYDNVCVKRVKRDFQLIGNTYKKCIKTETVSEGINKRNEVIYKRCISYADVAVPLTQTIDVYRNMRDYVYAFSKTYTIKDCQGPKVDLPDEEIPDNKR